MALTLLLVLVAGCAAASFAFALAEAALFSLGKWRLREMAEKGGAAEKAVAALLEHPQDVLAAIVLGNTFATAALVLSGFWMVSMWDYSFWAIFPLILFLVLFACEVFPKTLAVRSPEIWAARTVHFIRAWRDATRFLRDIAQKIITGILSILIPKTIQPRVALNDEEYQELIESAFQQGALGRAEKEIIFEIINLDRKTAREVMRPRSQMACISDDLSVEEMIAAARKYKHARLPMYDETPDTIVGVLNTETLLANPEVDLSEAIEFPSFVPGTMNLLQLLKSLQRQKRRLAIVLDEFGGTAGVVTVQDILAEMVGSFHRVNSSEKFVMEKFGDGKWRLSGAVRLDDFRREYPGLREIYDVETIGGLMVRQLEIVPAAGQSVVVDGLRLTARSVDERRVKEVVAEVSRKGKGPHVS